MVFKKADKGAKISWHRDQRIGTVASDTPIAVNVDFYLDRSTLENCLWAIPKSQLWSDEKVEAFIEELGDDQFNPVFVTPTPVEPGDALLHNIFVLHGSPESRSDLRRVLYYEFRNREREVKWGPHDGDYTQLKQDTLDYCASLRRGGVGDVAPQLRVWHEDHWQPESAFVQGQL